MPWNLALTGPSHDLAHAFDDVPEPACQTRLPAGKLAAIGVDGKTSLIGGISGFIKRTDLTLLDKTRIFEAHGREDGVSIIEFSELDILGPIAGHLKGSGCRYLDRRRGDS